MDVIGLIDIKGTFLFHEENEILNPELAKLLKRLSLNYHTKFHLFSSDSLSGFKSNSHIGVPKFWQNYGDISGLSKEAILGNGLFDISNPDPLPILSQSFSKQSPAAYKAIASHYGTNVDMMFLLDDDKMNLLMAQLTKVNPINSQEKDYLRNVENFVVTHAALRFQ